MKEKYQISITAWGAVLYASGTQSWRFRLKHLGEGNDRHTVFQQLSYGFFLQIGFCLPLPLPSTPAFQLLWTHLPNIIEAVFVEDRVNLGVLEGTEQQRLPVVLGPVVEIQHPHAGKVHPVGLQRQQVNVLHQVLHRQMKTHHCWHPWLPAKALTAVGKRAGTSKAAQNINKQHLPRHHCLEITDHSKSNLLDFLTQNWKLPSL